MYTYIIRHTSAKHEHVAQYLKSYFAKTCYLPCAVFVKYANTSLLIVGSNASHTRAPANETFMFLNKFFFLVLLKYYTFTTFKPQFG